jgi:membrane fusion protein (multidrug efflux system)
VHPAEVREETFHRTVTGIGTLEASSRIQVRPDASGYIRDIAFQRGTQVEAGQVLFRIDKDELVPRLQAAEAELGAVQNKLQRAQRTYRRILALRRQEAGTVDELDEARTQYQTLQDRRDRLEAQVQLLKEQIQDTSIRAAVDGVVSDPMVDIGDFVKRGRHLATLVSQSALEVRFRVGQQAMGQVRTGQDVRLSIDAWPDETFTAKVVYIAPSIDETTRQLTLIAVVQNDANRLKPGAFASAELVIDSRQSPAIPEEALVATQGGYRVYVIDDRQAVRREVEVGLRKPGLVEIRQGLEAGEKVVRTGHLRLEDSDRADVRVVRDSSEQNAGGPPHGAVGGKEDSHPGRTDPDPDQTDRAESP